MQAQKPCESFCLRKGWHAQFLHKELRIVCTATPQMPKRESASRCSRSPRSSKRPLAGLFRKAQHSELWDPGKTRRIPRRSSARSGPTPGQSAMASGKMVAAQDNQVASQ